jgi:hypothetical protein
MYLLVHRSPSATSTLLVSWPCSLGRRRRPMAWVKSPSVVHCQLQLFMRWSRL